MNESKLVFILVGLTLAVAGAPPAAAEEPGECPPGWNLVIPDQIFDRELRQKAIEVDARGNDDDLACLKFTSGAGNSGEDANVKDNLP
jgi:hypothetical protein